MAAKTAAAAFEEKPPIFEITPKWILICLIINFVIAISASALSFVINDVCILLSYFVILFAILYFFGLEYFLPLKHHDIPSQVYHPDLLPQKEFERLNKRFEDIEKMKHNINQTGQPIPEKFQQEYDNLKPIIDAQIELRTICLFKKIIGVPRFFVPENAKNKNDENVSEKSSPNNVKIPAYEISSKWIIIYLIVNFVIAVSASVLSFVINDSFPLFIYFFLYFTLVLIFLLNLIELPNNDITSQVYHPDLMPRKEFNCLKQIFKEVEKMKRNYDKAGQVLPQKYQQEYDALKPIYDAQMEIREICWFYKCIGVPKFSVQQNARNVETETDNEEVEKVQENTSVNAIPEAFVESDNEYESDAEIVLSSGLDSDGTDVPLVNDKKAKDYQDINKNIENDIEMIKIDNADTKNDLENLKAQFAEIKAENTKLKNFVETFIESQAIV